MASTGQPLGIGLSVDFSRLDSDLSKVADRIDKVGSQTTLKVGTSAGLASQGGGLPGGGLDPNQMAAQMGQVGVALSNGMTSGIGKTNALLIAMASRINATLERLAAVSISLFMRIDAAMRFPRLDTFLAKAQMGFKSLASGGKKEFSDLDFAIGGGLGKTAQIAAKLLKSAFAGLGKDLSKTIGEPIKEAIESLKPVILELGETFKTEMGAVAKAIKTAIEELPKGLKHSQAGFKDTQAAAHGLFMEIQGLTAEATKFPRFAEAMGKGMTGTRARPTLRPSGLLAEPPKALPAPTPKPLPSPPPPPPPKMFGYGMGGMAPALGDIGSLTSAVKVAIKTFTDFQAKAKNVDGALKMLGHTMGGWGTVVALPARALWKFSGIIEQVILKGATMGVGIVRSLNSVRSVMTSMGSVGDKVYKNLYEGQNKWGTLLALMPVGVAVRAISLLGTGAGYLPSIFGALGTVAKSAFLGMLPGAAAAGQAVGGVGAQATRSSGSLLSWGMTAAKAALLAQVSISNVPIGLIYLGAKLVALPFIKFLTGKKNVDSFGASVAGASGKTSVLGGALDGVNKSVEKVSNGFKSFAGQMLAAFGMIGIVFKVVEFFKGGVKAATELNSTVARSKATFGEAFGTVAEQAEKNAKAFHTSKSAQLELASALGGTAQGMGVSEEKSAELANQLTQLAVDAQGTGLAMNEVGEAIKTGLSGRAISLKELMVNIDENTTKAYAWKTGIAQVGQELTTQQTLMARAGQVMRGLNYVQGSLARNAGQAGVQFKLAGGGLSLFAEKIGEMMLPALKAGAVGFNELMSGALDFVSSSGPSITAWAEAGAQNVQDFIATVKGFGPTVVANLTWAWEEAKKGPLSFVIEGVEAFYRFEKAIPEAIGIAIRNAGTLWEIAKIEAGAFVENVLRSIGTLPENFSRIFEWLKRNWSNLLLDFATGFGALSDNLMKNAVNLGAAIWDAIQGKGFNFEFTPLLDGFKAMTEKLPDMIKPDLVDVSAEVKKLYEKIGENELKRPKFKGEGEMPGGEKMKPITGEDKSKEYKLGGALESGSKEAFSAISKGQTGRGSTTDAVKQGIAVQREHLAISKQQLAAMQNSAKMPAITVK